MNSKLIGGILLVIGTTIGAGMLALPIATAELGFWGSMFLFIVSWAVMTTCAFLFLEVNLWLPADSNVISMAGQTLGKWGQGAAWITYLVLLYSLIAAYIAGGGDLFHYLSAEIGIDMPQQVAAIIFTFVLGSVVYCGIRMVDYVNRGLMSFKMGAFVLVVILLLPYIHMVNLDTGDFHYLKSPGTVTVTAVSFGSLMIIPSLRGYFGTDTKSLRKAIFYGGLIPLICYILWDLVISGVIPLLSAHGLRAIESSTNSNSDLLASIAYYVPHNVIILLAKFFVSICMMTSFLSISLCLTDFLSDGLRIKKRGLGNIPIMAGTFLPPLIAVLFYPDAFLKGLSFAGISIIILMVLFPPLMAWRGRYYKVFAHSAIQFQMRGGKVLLSFMLICAAAMIGCGIEGLI